MEQWNSNRSLLGWWAPRSQSAGREGQARGKSPVCTHTPVQPSQARGPGARGLFASSLSTLERRGWVEVWPKPHILWLASAAELGQLVPSTSTVLALQQGEAECIPAVPWGECPGVGWEDVWDGCAVALGCTGQGLKQSPIVSGEKVSSPCMASMGNSTERGCWGRGARRKMSRESWALSTASPRKASPARG